MRSSRRFERFFAALAVTLAASGCGDSGGGGGAGGAGSGASGQGGEVGQGGEGAATTAASTSVASTSSSVASVASSSASTGSGPLVCPGGGYASFPQSPECDMLQQDCEPGFTCERRRVGGMTITSCVPRGGLKGIASGCEIDEECESGLFCVFNVCTPVCCPSTEEPCGGGNCNLNLSFSNGDTIVVCTYSKQCTPLSEDACPPGSGCHFEEPTVATCIQRSGTNVPEGGECEALNDCGDMLQCTASGCRWICALEDNGLEPGLGGCPDGQTCIESQAIGAAGIGVCDPD